MHRRNFRRNFGFERDALAAGAKEAGLHAGIDKIGDLHRAELDFQLAGFDARQFQQVVSNARQGYGVVAE